MESSAGFDMNWYKLWMKQSQEFFDSANKHLRELFARGEPVNPADHVEKINAWLETLKLNWSAASITNEHKDQAYCWNVMQTIYSNAADGMTAQWIQRTQENNPIKNTHELYELWLKSCQEMYQKMLSTKTYHETYSEFMNKALKFWESTTRKW